MRFLINIMILQKGILLMKVSHISYDPIMFHINIFIHMKPKKVQCNHKQRCTI